MHARALFIRVGSQCVQRSRGGVARADLRFGSHLGRAGADVTIGIDVPCIDVAGVLFDELQLAGFQVEAVRIEVALVPAIDRDDGLSGPTPRKIDYFGPGARYGRQINRLGVGMKRIDALERSTMNRAFNSPWSESYASATMFLSFCRASSCVLSMSEICLPVVQQSWSVQVIPRSVEIPS
jgi:hypothetical protein